MRTLEEWRHDSCALNLESIAPAKKKDGSLTNLVVPKSSFVVELPPKIDLEEKEKDRKPGDKKPDDKKDSGVKKELTKEQQLQLEKIEREYQVKKEALVQKYMPKINQKVGIIAIGKEYTDAENSVAAAEDKLIKAIGDLQFEEFEQIDKLIGMMRNLIKANDGLPITDAKTIEVLQNKLNRIMSVEKKGGEEPYPPPKAGYSARSLDRLAIEWKGDIVTKKYNEMTFEFSSAIGSFGKKGSSEITFRTTATEDYKKRILAIPDVVARRDQALEKHEKAFPPGEFNDSDWEKAWAATKKTALLPIPCAADYSVFMDVFKGDAGFNERVKKAFPNLQPLKKATEADHELQKALLELYSLRKIAEATREKKVRDWLSSTEETGDIADFRKLCEEYRDEVKSALEKRSNARRRVTE